MATGKGDQPEKALNRLADELRRRRADATGSSRKQRVVAAATDETVRRLPIRALSRSYVDAGGRSSRDL